MAVIFSPRSLCGCQCSPNAKALGSVHFPIAYTYGRRWWWCTIGRHCVWGRSPAPPLSRLISHRYPHVKASTHTDTQTRTDTTLARIHCQIGKLSQQVSFATLGNNIYFIQFQNGQPLSCVLPARLPFLLAFISNHNDLRRSLSQQGLEGTAPQQ